jgi:hypothetical protein
MFLGRIRFTWNILTSMGCDFEVIKINTTLGEECKEKGGC